MDKVPAVALPIKDWRIKIIAITAQKAHLRGGVFEPSLKASHLRWLWGLLVVEVFVGMASLSFADMSCGLKNNHLKPDVAWKAPLDIAMPPGWALSWPEAVVGASKFWFDHDQHEYGYVDGTRSLDGTRFDLDVEVRNGSKIDGRHFAVMLELIDSQGKIVNTTNTVNPFFGRLPGERREPCGILSSPSKRTSMFTLTSRFYG
jgi:hypothetical protein